MPLGGGMEKTMIIPGVVSVTFRKNSALEVIELARNSSLKAIEWGADVHVKVGDLPTAREAGEATRKSGLLPISYGSYYFIAHSEEKGDFSAALDTASALGAGNIRAWASRKASTEVTADEFRFIASEIAKKCDEAAERGMTLSLEYHPNTLTDCRESAVKLAETVARDNLRLYWQPDFTVSTKENLSALEAVLPWLGNIHAFSWLGAGAARYPLSHSRELFKEAADMIGNDGRDHGMLLEFVKGDDPEQFKEDAAELLTILS